MKSSYIKIIGIIVPFLVVSLVLPLSISKDDPLNSQVDDIKTIPSRTKMTMDIIVEEDHGIKSHQSEYGDPLKTEAISPTSIIRGDAFVVTGRLIDNETSEGIPGQPIYVFWERFSWSEYEADPSGFRSQYLIGQGSTNSTGYFTITCRDSSHSKSTGDNITVYSVFLGDPYLGPIQENRQFITDTITCYAQALLGIVDIGPAENVREGDSFYVIAALGYDNYSAIDESFGENIAVEFLGSTYYEPITLGAINITLNVPFGTTIDTYYDVHLSFNISILNLPYLVGDQISSVAEVGSPAADWCNDTGSIYVYTGASITFDIDSPTPPGIGLYPEILRNETSVFISGTLTNSTGGSFGVPYNIYVEFSGTTIKTLATAANGDFSTSFIINSTSKLVGDHEIIVDVVDGQGIDDTIFESEYVTIVSNSTMLSNSVNGSAFLAGEIVRVSGRIEDVYDPGTGVSNMDLIGQWEDFGAISNATTQGNGDFEIDILIPLSINPALENGTVYLYSSDDQYYTASNGTFVVELFSSVSFNITLNQSLVLDGALITDIGGDTLYTNSNFTVSFNLTDQFSRPLVFRNITTNISGVFEFQNTTNANGMTGFEVWGVRYGIQNITYTVTITIDDNPSSSFSFDLEFEEVPPPTPPPTSTPGITPTGSGLNMFGKAAIGIFVSILALIIIIAVIYGFGRFRKKKQPDLSTDGFDSLDLSTIMKMMADAERAKDYQRAVILCYQAFVLLCIESLGILNARTSSPRELARIVAATNRIPVRDVTMLVMRFEEAQYSNHKISKNAYNLAKQAYENAQLALKNLKGGPKTP